MAVRSPSPKRYATDISLPGGGDNFTRGALALVTLEYRVGLLRERVSTVINIYMRLPYRAMQKLPGSISLSLVFARSQTPKEDHGAILSPTAGQKCGVQFYRRPEATGRIR